MNLLVLGSGGREHAIAWALAKSPRCQNLYVAPGNGGTAAIAENVNGLNISDTQAIAAFCEEHQIDLVVIGPEAPLVAGVADGLRARGLKVFGPNAAGAVLEGSKAAAKLFMERYGIPTAKAAVFTNCDDALDYVQEQGAPIVIKADGLAAGKGVVVADELEEAEDAVQDCFDGAFGEAGETVVIEECMKGPECSLLAFVSNGKAACMVPAQDHKRAFDGDRGPNTGGMGVYSPVPMVDDDTLAAMTDIMEKAAAATAQDSAGLQLLAEILEENAEEAFGNEGSELAGSLEFSAQDSKAQLLDYRGCLYGGFMITEEGPKIVEFNVRFGDPETQVVLPRLKSDLVDIMEAVADGRPEDISLEWSDDWAVCVVLTSAGYPGSYEKGKVILGIEEAEAIEGVTVFHAGTRSNYDEELITDGGRVLNVVALGESFEEARERAYRACDLIFFEGKTLRSDIGAQAAKALQD